MIFEVELEYFEKKHPATQGKRKKNPAVYSREKNSNIGKNNLALHFYGKNILLVYLDEKKFMH